MYGWVTASGCLCVFAYLSVFVIMCVYIYSVPTCVCDKCVFPYSLAKTSLCALCMCVDMCLCFSCGWGHISSRLS